MDLNGWTFHQTYSFGVERDDGIYSYAEISPDKLYRYRLSRTWDKFLPQLGWVMLNPSTADGLDDDPTIRRCVGFAKANGFGGIVVANLFAWRATDPKQLKTASDPVGPLNDMAIRSVLRNCPTTIAAWGANGDLLGRASAVLSVHRDSFFVLKLTKGGHPCHPLYLKADLKPVRW